MESSCEWIQGNQVRLKLAKGIADLNNGGERATIFIEAKENGYRIECVTEKAREGKKANACGFRGEVLCLEEAFEVCSESCAVKLEVILVSKRIEVGFIV